MPNLRPPVPNPRRVPHISPLRCGFQPRLNLLSLPLLAIAAFLLAQSLPTPQAAATAASPVHGAALFATNGCAHCHGPAGSGGDRGPDLKNVRRRLTSAQITTQIHNGGQSMPPFGDVFTPQDITDLVAYLRATHKPPPPPDPPKRAPSTPASEPAPPSE